MSLLAEDLRREYEELEKNGFPIGQTLDFGKKLGTSAELDLHFEMVLEDAKKPFSKRWHPEDFFRFHRQEGVCYLRQLLTSENIDYAVGAAYLMAELLPKGRYEHQAELIDDLNKTLVLLAETENPEHRRKCIIALGWVGTEYEIPTLKRHLLTDSDSLCRAWSASSFLQMCGRVSADILQEQTLDTLVTCFEQETDVFVRGVAVEAVQDIWNVKFGLRSSAVESRNQKAVDRAVKRALEYLTENNQAKNK